MDNKSDNLITVMTFSYPHELAIIRARLESEGIECFVQDELTTQINPFYSNAIGGVKLQVKESDVPIAIEILKDGGFFIEDNSPESKFVTNLDKYTSRLPFLKRVRLEIRLIVIFVILTGLIATIVFL